MTELFKSVKPRRVTEDIVAQILQLVGMGDLSPGERLPSERELAQSLGVSRPTLREALKRLEYAGVLNTVHGGGTYVRDVAREALRDPLLALVRGNDSSLVEMAEFRTAIESWAAAQAARRAGPEDLINLEAILRAMEERVAAGEPLHQLDAQFHLAIARAASNAIYFHVASTIFHLFAQIAQVSHENIFPTRKDQSDLLAEHRAIFLAIQTGNPASAQELMHRHLAQTEQWFRANQPNWTGESSHERN